MIGKKVPCVFDDCPSRVPFELFDESVWLPVFKGSREHWGFACEQHVREVRAGQHAPRYLLSWSGPDELIIDMEPLPPKTPRVEEDVES